MSHDLAHHLAETGFRVIFISHFPYFEMPETIKTKSGKLVVCSWPTKKRPTNAIDFWWFTRLYFKYKPDFVIGHFVGSNISILLSKILSLRHTKTFDYYHTISGAIITDLETINWTQKLLFLRKKIFYKLFCDHIICPSVMAKSDLLNFFDCKNTVVIPNPLRDRYIFEDAIRSEAIVISYLGRFEPTKGILELIEAFKDYQNLNANSNLKLQIAGSGSLLNEVVKLVKNVPNITLVGQLKYDEVDNFIKKSHYTIIPSKYDNLPTVGIESLMNGKPILISLNTGLTPFINDYVNGFKFQIDKNGFYDVFEKATFNFDKISILSKNARILFEKEFTTERYFNDIKSLLQ